MEGEEEIALQIVHIKHIEHHVDVAFAEFAHHIGFFGRIGAERISAGEVDKSDGATVVGDFSHHARHRDAGIVACALVSTRECIEYRGFSAVGIANQSHRNGAFSLRRNGLGRTAGRTSSAGRRTAGSRVVGGSLGEIGGSSVGGEEAFGERFFRSIVNVGLLQRHFDEGSFTAAECHTLSEHGKDDGRPHGSGKESRHLLTWHKTEFFETQA